MLNTLTILSACYLGKHVIVVLVGRRQLDKELGAADVRVTVQCLVQVLSRCQSQTTTLAVFRSLRVQIHQC